MSKDDKGTDLAEALGSVLNRVLSPLMDRLERLEARSAAANPPAAPPASADEQMAKLMAAMRGQQEGLEEFGLVEVVEGCTSDVSGATFDAEVQYPVIKHMGKIVGKGPEGHRQGDAQLRVAGRDRQARGRGRRGAGRDDDERARAGRSARNRRVPTVEIRDVREGGQSAIRGEAAPGARSTRHPCRTGCLGRVTSPPGDIGPGSA